MTSRAFGNAGTTTRWARAHRRPANTSKPMRPNRWARSMPASTWHNEYVIEHPPIPDPQESPTAFKGSCGGAP